MDEVKLRDLVKKRGICKRRITLASKNLLPDIDETRKSTLHAQISAEYVNIGKFDDLISELYSKLDGEDICPQHATELEEQMNYGLQVGETLTNLKVKVTKPSASVASNCELKLPILICGTFSGEGSDSLEYSTFVTEFNNIIGLRPQLANSTKFTYLKTYLKGYALKVVNHLTVTDENYLIAWTLLETEFLNKEALIDDLLVKFLSIKPKFDQTYLETKLYINEMRSIFSDLKNQQIDFMKDPSCIKLVSHVVFSKLPIPFKRELIHKLDDNYPTVTDIFDNYVEIIRTLNLRMQSKPVEKPVQTTYHNSSFKSNTKQFSKEKSDVTPKVESKTEYKRQCKFCSALGHSMYGCQKYDTHEKRVQRCNELKYCTQCSSARHVKEACPGKLDYACTVCGSKTHVSALCPKFKPNVTTNGCCIYSANDSAGTYLLPTITVRLSRGKHVATVRCLLDTGSQRSYMSAAVAQKLQISPNEYNTKLLISTFVLTAAKDLLELGMTVRTENDGRDFSLPIFFDDKFELNYDIYGLPDAINNIKQKFTLADVAFENTSDNTICIDGLIGVDAIDHIDNLAKVPCLSGSAFVIDDRVVPFGNIDNFLTREQLELKYSNNSSPAHVQTQIHSVLNPVGTCFDPISDVFEESQIEGKLDNLFKVESLGITDSNVSEFDKRQIDEFTEGISKRDGKYHVKLPWYPDKINTVKPNYGIAKSVMHKVVKDLETKGLYDQYNEVFEQQLRDDIIEEVSSDELDISDCVFIPHRPVVRMQEQVTTKIRPVLNCSLKVGKDSASLNEASYPGIDLLSNLLVLLMMIRTNYYLVVSDIRKAFLQIRLSLENDRNKFCVIWQHASGKLRIFRYKTLVFGLAASPFILNYIIKNHLSQYSNDSVNQILNNNFYVDNLFFSGNDIDELTEIYKTACDRMTSGGFDLCSWFSNDSSLQAKFHADDRATSHSSAAEKVLGYMYLPVTDELSIADFKVEKFVSITKRIVLSQISRIFDPLGLISPLLVKHKIFMRKLWINKCSWDEELSSELSEEWKKLYKDLIVFSQFKFSRRVLNTSDNNKLIIFCDASKLSFGFTSYTVTNEASRCESNLLFAKFKVAPLKSKTLPTLELLAIFLAVKCLNIQLKIKELNITEVFIVTDSQVALTWVVSGRVKSKGNIFASNRVKDIVDLTDQIKQTYNISCNFKYTPTDLNPADLLTRGLTLNCFQDKIEFWKQGPSFISEYPLEFPMRSSGCLSSEVLSVVNNCNTVSDDTETVPVFSIERFSTLSKLLRVTTLILIYVQKVRRQNFDRVDLRRKAELYWLKSEQRSYFKLELDYLKSPSINKTIPNLVNNLNLFIDDSGLLRAKGRLTKCESFSYDVINPVMLPKLSFLTKLIIQDVHSKCRHLGVNSTLTRLRLLGYWVPKGRFAVKKILSECIICKKINAFSFKYPKPTGFVSDKLNFTKPFAHTGVDYTGHFFVKIGEVTNKYYLLVFTCLSTRAIHLELVPSMSTTDFLLAFIKFTNYYWMPKSIYSDNASTFSLATSVINQSSTDDPLQEFMETNNIRHIRIPVYAAWVGAAWERLIRVIKNCIYKTIGRRKLEFHQFSSLLTDVQNVINSRPLTYRDADINNLDVLTPNHFLKITSSGNIDFGSFDGNQLELPRRSDLVASLNKRDELFSKFKDLWYDSYLLSLRETSREMYEREWTDIIKPNDVVLIYSPGKPRAFWPLGRVTELLTGSDDKTRCVRVRRSDSKEEVYSINHLYPLELALYADKVDEIKAPEVTPQDEARPTRAAALKCREALKLIANE